MDESSKLYMPLLSPEDSVRKYRYNPFLRGKYIRALKELICNDDLPEIISPDLLSVINDCLFPSDIEAILTQHSTRPCLLAEILVRNIPLKKYPAIQKVAEKYKNGSLLLHKFAQQVDQNISDEDLQAALENFRSWKIDFNTRDAKGNTALHIAAQRGLDVAVKVLVENFGAAPELSNNALEIPRVTGDIILSPLHVAIERRDVDYFQRQLNEHNMNREHLVLGTPISHLEKLINKYAHEKKWHSPREWWRNRKLEKMLEIYNAKTLSSNSLRVQEESELEAYTPSYVDVFTPGEKPDNFSEEWVVNVFKKKSEVVDKLLARCLEKKDGWKVLFNAAMNPALELKVEQRQHLLEKVLAELDFLAPRAEVSSQLIKDFSEMYKVAQLAPENKALLSKVFEQLKPMNLVNLMGRHDPTIVVPTVAGVKHVH